MKVLSFESLSFFTGQSLYFEPSKATTIVTDAGPIGVSAILMQHSPNQTDYRVVAYSSRTLTDVEKRFSQIKKECLGILHACEKSRMYLLGGKFTVPTDHKPLVSLLMNPNSIIPLRIERWSLRLQEYDFEVKHIKGQFNPADYCSRHITGNKNSVTSMVTEAHINFVVNNARPIAVTLKEIREHTNKDVTLTKLRNLIENNSWHTLDKPNENFKNCNLHELKIYRRILQELTVTSDQSMILRRNRIVIPAALRTRMIALAHENHLGIAKTKSLLRDKIYFPGMDATIEEALAECLSCTATSRPDPPPPLQPPSLPPAVWHTLNIDFLGPFPNQKYLLVVIDQYSRYPEVEIISSTTAQQTINSLTKVFATHGLPYKVISDNGPPFPSAALKEYMVRNNIKHHRITPLHPKANGMAENFMRNLNKTLRTALIDQTPWVPALYQFLQHYRSAAHSTTQVSPAEVLFKRKLRLKIPALNHDANEQALANLPHKDATAKAQMKRQVDGRYKAIDKPFDIGDYVLVRQQKQNKLTSRFDPKPYRLTNIKGTMLSAQRPGHTITHNTQHFKFLSRQRPKNFGQGVDDDSENDDEVSTNDNEYQERLDSRKTYPTRQRRRPQYLHER